MMDVHDRKVGVLVLQFLPSSANRVQSGLHGGKYARYPRCTLICAAARHAAWFECEAAQCQPYFNFGRSCTFFFFELMQMEF